MSPLTRYRGSWGRSQFVQQIDAEQSEEAPGGRALGHGGQKKKDTGMGFLCPRFGCRERVCRPALPHIQYTTFI